MYKNLEHALPIVQTEKKAKGEFEVSVAELGKINLGGDLSDSASRLLVKIDEKLSKQMVEFRIIYAAFQIDPCTNSDWLNKQVTKILESRNYLEKLELQAWTLIELIKENKITEEQAVHQLSQIGIAVGSPDPLVTPVAIDQARKDAHDMGGVEQ